MESWIYQRMQVAFENIDDLWKDCLRQIPLRTLERPAVQCAITETSNVLQTLLKSLEGETTTTTRAMPEDQYDVLAKISEKYRHRLRAQNEVAHRIHVLLMGPGLTSPPSRATLEKIHEDLLKGLEQLQKETFLLLQTHETTMKEEDYSVLDCVRACKARFEIAAEKITQSNGESTSNVSNKFQADVVRHEMELSFDTKKRELERTHAQKMMGLEEQISTLQGENERLSLKLKLKSDQLTKNHEAELAKLKESYQEELGQLKAHYDQLFIEMTARQERLKNRLAEETKKYEATNRQQAVEFEKKVAALHTQEPCEAWSGEEEKKTVYAALEGKKKKIEFLHGVYQSQMKTMALDWETTMHDLFAKFEEQNREMKRNLDIEKQRVILLTQTCDELEKDSKQLRNKLHELDALVKQEKADHADTRRIKGVLEEKVSQLNETRTAIDLQLNEEKNKVLDRESTIAKMMLTVREKDMELSLKDNELQSQVLLVRRMQEQLQAMKVTMSDMEIQSPRNRSLVFDDSMSDNGSELSVKRKKKKKDKRALNASAPVQDLRRGSDSEGSQHNMSLDIGRLGKEDWGDKDHSRSSSPRRKSPRASHAANHENNNDDSDPTLSPKTPASPQTGEHFDTESSDEKLTHSPRANTKKAHNNKQGNQPNAKGGAVSDHTARTTHRKARSGEDKRATVLPPLLDPTSLEDKQILDRENESFMNFVTPAFRPPGPSKELKDEKKGTSTDAGALGETETKPKVPNPPPRDLTKAASSKRLIHSANPTAATTTNTTTTTTSTPSAPQKKMSFGGMLASNNWDSVFGSSGDNNNNNNGSMLQSNHEGGGERRGTVTAPDAELFVLGSTVFDPTTITKPKAKTHSVAKDNPMLPREFFYALGMMAKISEKLTIPVYKQVSLVQVAVELSPEAFHTLVRDGSDAVKLFITSIDLLRAANFFIQNVIHQGAAKMKLEAQQLKKLQESIKDLELTVRKATSEHPHSLVTPVAIADVFKRVIASLKLFKSLSMGFGKTTESAESERPSQLHRCQLVIEDEYCTHRKSANPIHHLVAAAHVPNYVSTLKAMARNGSRGDGGGPLAVALAHAKGAVTTKHVAQTTLTIDNLVEQN